MVTYQFGTLLASQRQGIVRLIPLPEGGAVHQNHTVLHQGFGPDQLVIRGVVDHINDSGLTCAACRQQNSSHHHHTHKHLNKTVSQTPLQSTRPNHSRVKGGNLQVFFSELELKCQSHTLSSRTGHGIIIKKTCRNNRDHVL